MEIREGFWKIWGKFVGVLIGILILWIALIFICDKVLERALKS